MMDEEYQEIVYILREDGTVEEKFALPDRVEDVIGQNFNHNENVVNISDILAPSANINVSPNKMSSNFNTVTLVNERGEEITSCPSSQVALNDHGNLETVFHLNGLDQLSFDVPSGSNFTNSIISQVPQQLMELDDSVINSENVNIFEIDEGSDSIQLLPSSESPNKFILNTINLNNSNSYSTSPRPQSTNYSFNVPRTYARNVGNSKIRTSPGQGVSQLLLAHEMSTMDQSAPILIANARSVTLDELEWIKSPGDKDEFIEDSNPDVITYGTEEVTTTKEQSMNYIYHDGTSSVPLHVSFTLEPEIKTEPNPVEEVKLDNPLQPDPALQQVQAQIEAGGEACILFVEDNDKGQEEHKKLEMEIDTELGKLKRRKRARWLLSSLDPGDELLRNFKRRPNKTKKWMCGLCYGWFQEKENLDKHLHETHFKTAKFQKCRFCRKKFFARFLCLRHEKTHKNHMEVTELPLKRYCIRGNKPSAHFKETRKSAPLSEAYTGYILDFLKRLKLQFYDCTDCDLKFKTDVEAREHYDVTHAVQECATCYKKFFNMAQLEEHQTEAHDIHFLKSYPNDYWSLQEVLNLEFDGKRDDTVVSRVDFLHPYAKSPDLEPPERRNYFNYLKRMKTYEAEQTKASRANSKFRFLRKKPQQMPKLEAAGSSSAAAVEKVEPGPGDGPPPLKQESSYECKICFESFPTDAEFSDHIKARHSYEVKPKPFPCTFCDKKFATHSNRKEHERIHTQEKNYICPFCNKAFIQISNLKKHVSTHKDQNLKCNTCDKQFITKNSLILHQRAHAADRKFRCNLCDRAYNYASLLKRHMRIHTGECPYECDICFQPFHELVSLHYHRKKVHTGERPHKCDICGKAFILSSDLKKHSSVHNKTDPNAPAATKTAKPGRLPRAKRSVEENLGEMKPYIHVEEPDAETSASTLVPVDNMETLEEAE